MQLAFRTVEDPRTRNHFSVQELGAPGGFPVATTLLHIKTLNGTCYEVWVCSGSATESIFVVVRCEQYPDLRTPRAAQFYHQVGEQLFPRPFFASGISMAFQYALPDGSWVWHRSGTVAPGGIAVVPAADTQSFHDAVRIFRETVLHSDILDPSCQALWSLLDDSFTPEVAALMYQRVMSFQEGARRVLCSIFAEANEREALHEVLRLFNVLFEHHWRHQDTAERGATLGSAQDMAAFNKLRAQAGMESAISVRGGL